MEQVSGPVVYVISGNSVELPELDWTIDRVSSAGNLQYKSRYVTKSSMNVIPAFQGRHSPSLT